MRKSMVGVNTLVDLVKISTDSAGMEEIKRSIDVRRSRMIINSSRQRKCVLCSLCRTTLARNPGHLTRISNATNSGSEVGTRGTPWRRSGLGPDWFFTPLSRTLPAWHSRRSIGGTFGSSNRCSRPHAQARAAHALACFSMLVQPCGCGGF